MRCLQVWTCVVHLTLFCFFLDRVTAAPPLTTVQDTLYKADGTRFNGVAYVEWNSFQASDASVVATSSVVVPIVDGALRVRLVPTSNASAGAHYFVRYQSDGKVQFTETWNVIPSATPVNLAAVRVANGAITGGSITPPSGLSVTDIAGLTDELDARPVKGFAYVPDRIVKTGATGALEGVQGNLDDCIHVDGTTGPCGGGTVSGGSAPGFIDLETPAGTIDGSNTVFSLSQAPSPASSLQLYRNGLLLNAGTDYSLSGTTVTFLSGAVPQTGDVLMASYRLPSGSGNDLFGPGYIDMEVPAGTINGSNTVFTLAQAPSPAASLQLFRNGLMLNAGVDYSLSNGTITFASLSVPQTGDMLLASYRLPSSANPLGGAAGALTGSYPAPQIAASVITNYNVSAAAGIQESKLALLYPTHSNANDPSANEKAAFGGTAGAPSAANKFVTDLDARLTNARPAQAHALLGGVHSDTTAGTVQRGDLVFGSFATGSAKWTRLPLGPANRCLVSNGVDAVWNTCLFTGFQAGTIPFTTTGGTLAEAPMHFTWDNSNRRLSVGSNLNSSTLTVYDSGASGSTTVTVRGGLAQGQNLLQVWQNSSGMEQASLGADGVLAVKSVEASSSATRPAWRESGTSADPSGRANGDAWLNTTAAARKTVEAGQMHTLPQVLCAANGATITSTLVASLGTCNIPAGVLHAGDRVAIRATWSHSGAAAYQVRWRWGSVTAGAITVPATAMLLDQKGEAALYDASAVLDGASKGSDGYTGGTFVASNPEAYGSGLLFSLEGNVQQTGDTLRLLQFTLVRFPAQANP